MDEQRFKKNKSDRFYETLQVLKDFNDPTGQLLVLQEMAEVLSVAMEDMFQDSLQTLSSLEFIQLLVNIIERTDGQGMSPELLLMSCRCLVNLVEAYPLAMGTIVRAGVVDALVTKLLHIEYMDLAEQILGLLERISIDFPVSLLKANALIALLQYIDFFGLSVQRSAITTAANATKGLGTFAFSNHTTLMDQMSDILDIVLRLMTLSDKKMVEQSSICLARIIDWLSKDVDQLERLVTSARIACLLQLADAVSNPLSTNYNSLLLCQLLKVLCTICKSTTCSRQLVIEHNFFNFAKQMLNDQVSILQSTIQRSSDEFLELFTLTNQLLPKLSDDFWDFKTVNIALPPPLSIDFMDLYCSFLPFLFQSHRLIINSAIRRKIIISITKAIVFSSNHSFLFERMFSVFIMELMDVTEDRIWNLGVAFQLITLSLHIVGDGLLSCLKKEGIAVKIDAILKEEYFTGKDLIAQVETTDSITQLLDILQDHPLSPMIKDRLAELEGNDEELSGAISSVVRMLKNSSKSFFSLVDNRISELALKQWVLSVAPNLCDKLKAVDDMNLDVDLTTLPEKLAQMTGFQLSTSGLLSLLGDEKHLKLFLGTVNDQQLELFVGLLHECISLYSTLPLVTIESRGNPSRQLYRNLRLKLRNEEDQTLVYVGISALSSTHTIQHYLELKARHRLNSSDAFEVNVEDDEEEVADRERIQFFYKGKQIPVGVPVFNTLYQHYSSSISDIWTTCHELTFKVAPACSSPPCALLYDVTTLPDDLIQALNLMSHIQKTKRLQSHLYYNHRLLAQIKRQLEEPLLMVSKCVPAWTSTLVRMFPELIPFETRELLFSTVSKRYLDKFRTNNTDANLPKPLKQKVVISRDDILSSTMTLMQALEEGCLEIQFQDEEGTGSGPTLEYFSLVSLEFMKADLWRSNRQQGLYPKPFFNSPLFYTLGRCFAKSILDDRIFSVTLNPILLKPLPVELKSLELVDETLYHSLVKLQTLSDQELSAACIDFTLPGTLHELVPNGSNVNLNSSNLNEYIHLVVEACVGKGVESSVKAFQQGFCSLIDTSYLECFTAMELSFLLGGFEEDWSKETLREAIVADHGYSKDSRVIQDLIEFMTGLDKQQRQEFLLFMTGSYRLPIGGFSSLSPPLTVVRKVVKVADEYLPSVMTCVNYLKLPEYSNLQVLTQRFLMVMKEGQGSFHLS